MQDATLTATANVKYNILATFRSMFLEHYFKNITLERIVRKGIIAFCLFLVSFILFQMVLIRNGFFCGGRWLSPLYLFEDHDIRGCSRYGFWMIPTLLLISAYAMLVITVVYSGILLRRRYSAYGGGGVGIALRYLALLLAPVMTSLPNYLARNRMKGDPPFYYHELFDFLGVIFPLIGLGIAIVVYPNRKKYSVLGILAITLILFYIFEILIGYPHIIRSLISVDSVFANLRSYIYF